MSRERARRRARDRRATAFGVAVVAAGWGFAFAGAAARADAPDGEVADVVEVRGVRGTAGNVGGDRFVLERAELDAFGALDVVDALRNVPGVHIDQPGAQGQPRERLPARRRSEPHADPRRRRAAQRPDERSRWVLRSADPRSRVGRADRGAARTGLCVLRLGRDRRHHRDHDARRRRAAARRGRGARASLVGRRWFGARIGHGRAGGSVAAARLRARGRPGFPVRVPRDLAARTRGRRSPGRRARARHAALRRRGRSGLR